MGFSRQEYWSGLPLPSPVDLPNPGIEPRSPAWQADSLPSEPPGKLYYTENGKKGHRRTANGEAHTVRSVRSGRVASTGASVTLGVVTTSKLSRPCLLGIFLEVPSHSHDGSFTPFPAPLPFPEGGGWAIHSWFPAANHGPVFLVTSPQTVSPRNRSSVSGIGVPDQTLEQKII